MEKIELQNTLEVILNMNKLIIVPIETIESRYTGMWNHVMREHADIWVYPEEKFDTEISDGEFLDINKTSKFKAHQLQMISELFISKQIENGDVFFIADIFFPGIEMIRYMADLQNISIKIFGFNHAGRADKSDFVQKLGNWADYSEQGYHSICDGIFVGSEFQKINILKKFKYPKSKIYVTGAIWDLDYIKKIYYKPEETNVDDIVIWPHRICEEKGFESLRIIAEHVDKQFIITNSTNKHNEVPLPFNVTYINSLSKVEYHKCLTRAKWYLSTAIQETFGYTIQEAVFYGCNIVAPNNVNAIPEMLPVKNLYSNLDMAIEMLNSDLDYTVDMSWTYRFDKNFLKMKTIMEKE